MTNYEVELSPAAARAFQKLDPALKRRLVLALEKLGVEAGKSGRIGGKTAKTIHGAADSFHRLRVGDFRVMYDVIDEDRVVLVLGIVNRRDLERWIRNR